MTWGQDTQRPLRNQRKGKEVSEQIEEKMEEFQSLRVKGFLIHIKGVTDQLVMVT